MPYNKIELSAELKKLQSELKFLSASSHKATVNRLIIMTQGRIKKVLLKLAAIKRKEYISKLINKV